MKNKWPPLFYSAIVICTAILFGFNTPQKPDDRFITYIVNTKTQVLQLYWKDEKEENFRSIQTLKAWLIKKNKKLVFAMNGGMYKEDRAPLGLYIENKKTKAKLNKANASGNFYLKPNGIFYILTDNSTAISTTKDFINEGNIKYATQSGPMLVIDGKIHPEFKAGGSANLNVRNGVGILPDKRVIFAMSKVGISLYDFADYFKKIGCMNALYLDGSVSRTYLPEQNWLQTGGNFGVIIGVTTD